MQKNKIDKLKDIANGWKNVFIRDEDVELLAESRMTYCTSCEHNVKNVCGLCGCPLNAKVRSVEAECPDGYWAARSFESS